MSELPILNNYSSKCPKCGDLVSDREEHYDPNAKAYHCYGESNREKQESINHPPHYTSLDAKCIKCDREIECIDVVRNMTFNLGNAVKYIWRCEHKGNAAEDLKKAIWYLEDELKRRGVY